MTQPDNSSEPLAIVILAAGKGTRMKSELHKVLHPIAGRPMLQHLMDSAATLGPQHQVVVVGSGREQLEKAVGAAASIAVQEPQFGTGHAVQQAQAAREVVDHLLAAGLEFRLAAAQLLERGALPLQAILGALQFGQLLLGLDHPAIHLVACGGAERVAARRGQRRFVRLKIGVHKLG